MIEFGETLRKAREAKGLSHRQLADSTHLMIQIVEDLENENFSKIVAPIYGRGFVKLYCEAVGIDPKPLIAEFMDIYNGNRPPTIRMRPVAPTTPESVATPEPEPVVIKTVPEPVAAPPPPKTDLFSIESTPEALPAAGKPAPAFVSNGPSRYAAPMPLEDDKPRFNLPRIPVVSIPPTAWRLLALACAAALILWLMWFCVRALYNATMLPKESAPIAEVQDAAQPTTNARNVPAEGAKRQPMSIPPLYID